MNVSTSTSLPSKEAIVGNLMQTYSESEMKNKVEKKFVTTKFSEGKAYIMLRSLGFCWYALNTE